MPSFRLHPPSTKFHRPHETFKSFADVLIGMRPEVVIIMFLLSAAGVLAWSLSLRYRQRELQHKERMAAIEKGGDLIVAKVGKRKFILKESLERLLEKSTQNPEKN